LQPVDLGRMTSQLNWERGSTPCSLCLAASDGFLQEAANDPWISGDRLFRQGRVGIDLAGQPLLGFAKYIAHDILEI
jgi:hypothetical protein